MLRVAANDMHAPLTTERFAVGTDCLDGCADFHGLHSADDSSFPTVRFEFYLDRVSDEHSDAVEPHLPGKVRQELLVSLLENDPEKGVRQSLNHGA